jgi:hypothetical protein
VAGKLRKHMAVKVRKCLGQRGAEMRGRLHTAIRSISSSRVMPSVASRALVHLFPRPVAGSCASAGQ